MILREEPSAGEHSALCRNTFSTSTSWDIHGHYVFFFFSWLVKGLVMPLATVIWNTFSYFTFHNFHLHSLYKIVSLVFFWGRGGVHHCEKKWFQNSTHLLFWRYMYFCNVLKNQYKKANTSINVAIALWLKHFFMLIISSSSTTTISTEQLYIDAVWQF